MSVQLQPGTQEIVDDLLLAKKTATRREAHKKIIDLPDKDQVAAYLIEQLDVLRGRWQRTWSLATLAEIGLAEGRKTVLDHTLDPPEHEPWARHFALIYAANFSPFPSAQIKKATNDADVLPRATALRLLLADGEDQYADELLKMLRDPDARGAWAAARALRNRSDVTMKTLRDRIEAKFIQPLVEIAEDQYVNLDSRWEAIQALASFVHHRGEIADLLGDLLVKDEDPSVRRYFLAALVELDQPDESQDALLQAVEDADAQIRLDSATALGKMLGPEKGIQLLLTRALEPETDAAWLLDALRHIDKDRAAKAIHDELGHPDPEVRARANQLLTELGGRTAAEILTAERAKALDKYTDILSDADKDVRDHFKELMSQAKSAFWLSLAMHVAVFAIGVWVLITSLSLALNSGLDTLATWIGVGGAGASALVILLTAFYRSPLRNVRASLNALMQVDVVFLGYVRQINQIDVTFKHMFLDVGGFGTGQMKATVVEIQAAVEKTLEEIQTHLLGK